ncbi:MAG: hypothetical protein Q4C90_01480 [Kocuria sp.]|uniref:Uncharacterized protein n=2 Tax=Kocuria TaxID=57493 RepID=A0A7D7KY78_KOCVA|nr:MULTISPECIES: hypothetical protein [Kocuria]WNB88802.1 hypothetical protein RGB72_12760 [Glutamicibacter protophormiae]MDO4255834.1 hypothetical protein [Kocuria sp.]QMS55691.1 hypothetical protein CIB50_0000380 [Kocuria varians]RUP85113.1 hypothetical protein D8M39_01670 [Kocuria sp. HSID17590]RUQ10925.1 hypothetical protein D8M38_03790 [Kocuria sp. HSID17582]
MSTAPNEPQNPGPGAPGQPGAGQPLGQGAVNSAPQGAPNGQPYGQVPANGAPGGQQYGQAGGKYGTTEYNPGQYTDMMERPSTVDRLLKLTLISLGISVVSTILSIIGILTADKDALLREQGGAASSQAGAPDMAQMVGTMGAVVGIISLVITIGLYLLVYFGLKKDKNWARILGTVFAAIAIVSGIFGLFSGTSGMSTGIYIAGIVLGVIKIIVDILWIVTAFKAPTTAWFNQNRVQR